MQTNCYQCGNELSFSDYETIQRSEECPKCLSSLRCCKMCSFYDNMSYNECRESSAERIVEKEKANFCGYFRLGSKDDKKDAKDDLLAKANSLFK